MIQVLYSIMEKLFPDYFSKNYRGQLNEDIIQKILKLYEEEKIGSNKISDRLLKENKLNINQGVIGRILTRARKNNLVKTIPKKDLAIKILSDFENLYNIIYFLLSFATIFNRLFFIVLLFDIIKRVK